MSTISTPSTAPFAAIIVAAGSGQRFGGDIPKQYARLHGKTVLRHTLEIFLSCPGLRDVRVVIDPAHQSLYDEAVQGLSLPSPVHGGKERKDSVRNALASLTHLSPETPVLIHDAARPCIKTELIARVVDTLQKQPAVTLATPVSDTLRKGDRGVLDDTINRTGVWALQTPQGFHYGLISKAHEAARHLQDVTDDTGVVSVYGQDVHIVEGSRQNIKITTQEDLAIASALLAPQTPMITRTALGYDVHALAPGNGTIRLGGIDIPHEKSLVGHSDADVVLHAVTDALLGTIAAGDIGTHFPPSDNSFKGMDSAVFLIKASDLVKEKSGKLIHVDITILGERPKISPYRDAMRVRIAEILSLPVDSVAIKATTTEKLGFTGREEGLVAQAVVTVGFPA